MRWAWVLLCLSAGVQSQCLPGSYTTQSDVGESLCEDCPAGRFSQSGDSTECSRCSEWAADEAFNVTEGYQPEPGKTTCIPPPDGSDCFPEAVSLEDCYCIPGYWGFPPNCTFCPSHSVCEDPDQPYPMAEEGYWISTDPDYVNTLSNPFLCIPPRSCPGGVDVCDNGYTGRACSKCDHGYFRLETRCRQCINSGDELNIGLVILFVAILLAIPPIFTLYAYFGSRWESGPFATTILIFDFTQMLVTYGFYRVNWPDSLLSMFDAFTLANFNLQLFQLECYQVDYTIRWGLSIGLPIVVLPSFLLFALVRRLYRRNRRDDSEIVARATSGYLLFLYLSFTFITTSAIVALDCTDIDGTSYMDFEPWIVCDTEVGDYGKYFFTSFAAITVYAFIFPSYAAHWLWRYRSRLGDPTFISKFGFFYHRFEREHFMQGFVVVFRKLGLVLISVLFNSRTLLQIILSLSLSFLSLLWHTFRHPYEHAPQDTVQFNMELAHFFFQFSGLLFFSEKLSEESRQVVEYLDLTVIGFLIVNIVIALLNDVRALRVEKRRKTAQLQAEARGPLAPLEEQIGYLKHNLTAGVDIAKTNSFDRLEKAGRKLAHRLETIKRIISSAEEATYSHQREVEAELTAEREAKRQEFHDLKDTLFQEYPQCKTPNYVFQSPAATAVGFTTRKLLGAKPTNEKKKGSGLAKLRKANMKRKVVSKKKTSRSNSRDSSELHEPTAGSAAASNRI